MASELNNVSSSILYTGLCSCCFLLTLYPGFAVSGSRSDSLSTGVSLNVKDEKLFNLLRLEDLVDESGARLLLGTLNNIDC